MVNMLYKYLFYELFWYKVMYIVWGMIINILCYIIVFGIDEIVVFEVFFDEEGGEFVGDDEEKKYIRMYIFVVGFRVLLVIFK